MDLVAEHAVAAKDAAARHDWAAALEHWQAITEETPDRVDAYAGKGHALLQLGRLDEADTVLTETTSRFPTHVWAAVHYGDVAARRRDWREALLRYEAVCDRFPQSFAGPLNKAIALRELGRLTEAEAVLVEAIEQFPANPWLASTFADLAARRDDWFSALERFHRVLERFPDHAFGYLGLTNALQRLNRLDEADDVIASASARFPEYRWIVDAYASSAVHRADWVEAVRRWDWMLSRFPGEKRALAGKAEALIQLGRLDEAESVCSSYDADEPAFRRARDLLVAQQRQLHDIASADVEPTQDRGSQPESFSSSSRQRVRRNSFFRRGRY
jgi:predicted Zn-dependent protease